MPLNSAELCSARGTRALPEIRWCACCSKAESGVSTGAPDVAAKPITGSRQEKRMVFMMELLKMV